MKYLILADGTVFQGKGIGANGDAIGEVVGYSFMDEIDTFNITERR